MQSFRISTRSSLRAALLAAALLFFSNAFNLLDNSDCQCASVSAAALCAAALHARHVTCLIAAAALLGFLWWNRPRARVFLGDAGSLLLGVWCVMLVLRADDAPGFTVNFKALPALWVPLYDTLSVIALRLWQGRPVWQGGQDHLAWRLMRRGMGPGRAALALAVASFLPAWSAAFLPGASGLLITASLLAGAALYETLSQRAAQPTARTAHMVDKHRQ